MHEYHEYRAYCDQTLARAEQLAQALNQAGRPEGLTVFNFVQDYACLGIPAGESDQFDTKEWASLKCKQPIEKLASSLALVLYFSDESPLSQGETFGIGQAFRKSPVIAIYHIDLWSNTERAMILLHEARHSLNRFGPKLANIPPLDQPDTEEAANWIFTISLIKANDPNRWHRAFNRELEWLKQENPPMLAPNQIPFACSDIYWPELDDLFRPTPHEHVKALRRHLLSLQANCEYWAPRLNVPPQEICGSIVKKLYAK